MGINQLPPQAYTRETLMQAFDWIKSQPRQVQDAANSTDALVSIYLQARRRHGVTSHPVSSHAFKQDLKSLAEGLRQFEDDAANSSAAAAASMTSSLPPGPNQDFGNAGMHYPQQTQMPPQQNHYGASSQQQAPQQHASPPYQAVPQYQQQPQHHVQQPAPQQAPAMRPQYQAPSMPAFEPTEASGLDQRSLEMIRLVQQRFNLSSETEALRMLLSLGFEKVREIFPKG